ncbi:SDR family NAD(P)-dependent oxidoreductase [Haloarchaeobius sp. DYHT-AS-18]|uniref:SDR family NAD(P)-dependent oxidoreductase n=1 Tax=Haloarchaeobius sp. DYHT-AS-18 TaxID=3446117 RepID=UPI003EBAC974
MSSSGAGQVVVLTGANEGIGHHMLRTLLDDGYRVVGLDIDVRNLESLQETYSESLRYHECDVTSDEDVEAAVDAVIAEWGQIDVLVNNAAVLNFGFLEDQTLEDARRTFEVNLFGYLRTIHAVLPHMRARNQGIIHNVSSGVGLVGNPGLTGYGATKGAIEAFTKSLRLELQNTNVAVTVMHPTLAATRQAKELDYPASQMSDPADVGRKLARKIASRKPVIFTDWVTRIGLAAAQRFPYLVKKGTRRFVEAHEAVPGTTTGDEPVEAET